MLHDLAPNLAFPTSSSPFSYPRLRIYLQLLTHTVFNQLCWSWNCTLWRGGPASWSLHVQILCSLRHSTNVISSLSPSIYRGSVLPVCLYLCRTGSWGMGKQRCHLLQTVTKKSSATWPQLTPALALPSCGPSVFPWWELLGTRAIDRKAKWGLLGKMQISWSRWKWRWRTV